MILLCSSDPKIRQRWRTAFDAGEACVELDAADPVRQRFAAGAPELILLHMRLSGLNGVAGVQALRAVNQAVKVMVFADVPDDNEGLRLLRAGVVGYSNTYMATELLRRAVGIVRAGEVWVGRKLIQRLITQLTRETVLAEPIDEAEDERMVQLTEREREIAALVGGGASNKRIAARLDITERTVKAHLSSIFRKTGTRDRLQLALLVNESERVAVPN